MALAVLLAACGESASSPASPEARRVEGGEALAQALARAMADPAVATEVRDLLRASPYVKHRVDFAQALEGERAVALRAALAHELGVSGSKLVSSVRSVGPLNLWVQSRAQRLTWRGTPGVIVAAQLKGEPKPTRAFAAAATLALEGLDTRGDAVAVFYLAPSKGLALRANPQPSVAGDVIQDMDDGEYGGLKVTTLMNGDTEVQQLAVTAPPGMRVDGTVDVDQPQQPSVLGPLYPGKTYLKTMIAMEPADNCLTPQSPEQCEDTVFEIEYQTKWVRRSNGQVLRYVLRTDMNVVGTSAINYHDYELIDRVPDPYTDVKVEVREDDGWFGEDSYGDYYLGHSNDSNWLSRIWHFPSHGGGNFRCAHPYVFANIGALSCQTPNPYAGGVYAFRELSYAFQWLHWTPPPVVPVVDGPSIIMPGITHTWGVGNLTQIIGTASYEWYLDGNLVGTSSSWSGSIIEASSVHSLQAHVVDAYGNYEVASMWVSVNTGQCDPNDPNCYEQLRDPTGSVRGRPTSPRVAAKH